MVISTLRISLLVNIDMCADTAVKMDVSKLDFVAESDLDDVNSVDGDLSERSFSFMF